MNRAGRWVGKPRSSVWRTDSLFKDVPTTGTFGFRRPKTKKPAPSFPTKGAFRETASVRVYPLTPSVRRRYEDDRRSVNRDPSVRVCQLRVDVSKYCIKGSSEGEDAPPSKTCQELFFTSDSIPNKGPPVGPVGGHISSTHPMGFLNPLFSIFFLVG